MNENFANKLFANLNILVLERLRHDIFKIEGDIPNWLYRLCKRDLSSGMKVLITQEDIPFLGNFLIDAEAFWENPIGTKLKSGFWSEMDCDGNECFLEASAMILEERRILLVEFVEEDYREKQNIIQKAREHQLSYDQLVKENQKKDILIHCIIHDIAGQLSGINCCLALLEMENLTAKGRERLATGRKQSMKQEILVREVLEIFSAEVNSLEKFSKEGAIAPDILHVTRECVDLLNPIYALNQVKIKLNFEDKHQGNNNGNHHNPNHQDWRVVGDRQRLERVITNLAENAFRYSPSNSLVTITLTHEPDQICFTIDDEGSGVAPELVPNLFKKFTQGQGKSGRLGLGLYFCRITIERWGGAIGYMNAPGGGSRFWFNLPHASVIASINR